jgi:hypothetical protein
MSICRYCGGEIIFRTEDGAPIPIHLSGGCYPSSSYTRIVSFVDPNARCPVCGDRVFFYRSPLDGRVFFDELGPPWPKHPCTDNANEHFPRPLPITSSSETEIVRVQAEWQRAGWKPFWCRKTEYKEDRNMTAISGKMEGEGREWTLFVGGDVRDLRDYPTLVRPNAKARSRYQVATFRLEGKKRRFKKLYLDAYLPAKHR